MKIFKAAYSSPILNSWFSNGINLLKSIIVIPVVVTQLSVEEANVFFLYFSFIGVGQAVQFGFNSTLIRFIAYSYSGVPIAKFESIKDLKNSIEDKKFDDEEFSEIVDLMRVIYLIISVLFFLILFIAGYYGLQKPINELQNPSIGWISWYVILCVNTVVLFLSHHRGLLEGINEVALVQRTIGMINLVGMPFILGVIYYSPTLFNLVLIYQVISFTVASIIYIISKSYGKKLKINDNRWFTFNKELFFIVWDSAWKTGITTVIANIVKHISSILVAQWFNASESASFQFTKRLFDILETFTMSSFKARIPKIASLRGSGNLSALLPYLKQTQWISYFVYLTGFGVLLFAGDFILKIIGSNVSLGGPLLVFSFALATFFARWTGMVLLISNQSNYVIEHVNALIVGIIFFVTVFIGYKYVGISIFPIGMFLGILITIPILAKQVYPTINTSFVQYESKVSIPALCILLLINFSHWIINF